MHLKNVCLVTRRENDLNEALTIDQINYPTLISMPYDPPYLQDELYDEDVIEDNVDIETTEQTGITF